MKNPNNLDSASENGPEKPGFRTKILSTRMTPEELREIEDAARHDGKKSAEWLRDTALQGARQHSTTHMESLMAELAALRYMLLNLFYATAEANVEGKHLLPQSVLKIRDQAMARKAGDARKLMESSSPQTDA